MKKQMKILVIDDEQLIRWSLDKHLSGKGFKVYTAASGEEGLKMFESHNPELVFLDNKLPEMQGLDVISKIKNFDEDSIIIFMTAYGSIETAVKAMKLGASDFINKPFSFEEIDMVIEEVSKKIKINKELQIYRRQQHDTISFDNIIGESKEIAEIIRLSKQISATETTTILLLGESGTGKDIFARAIHNASSRNGKPFITINCASLPETLLESELFGHEQGAFTDAKKLKKGLFEIAEGGTVFLDEIGEVDQATQIKLLGVLENRTVRRLGGSKDIPVEIRIIAATNKVLKKSVEEKSFREDLYYRLKVFQITLPPLRDHKSDIVCLSRHFIGQFNPQFRKNINNISPAAVKLLTNYNWPGNIRELRNVIERAVILETGTVLNIESLPGEIVHKGKEPDEISSQQDQADENFSHEIPDEGFSLYEMEKNTILQALDKSGNNQTKASKFLGITRDTLRYKIKKYQL